MGEWLTTQQLDQLVQDGHIGAFEVPFDAEERWDDPKGTIISVKVGEKIAGLWERRYGEDSIQATLGYTKTRRGTSFFIRLTTHDVHIGVRSADKDTDDIKRVFDRVNRLIGGVL